MTKFKIEFKWILAILIFSWIFMFLSKVLGYQSEKISDFETISLFSIIPLIYMYFRYYKEKKNIDYQGIMTLKDGLKSGSIFVIMMTILTPFSQWVNSSFISTEYFKNASDFVVSSGRMTIDQAANYFNLNNYIIMSSISTFVLGILLVIIFSFFFKTKSEI